MEKVWALFDTRGIQNDIRIKIAETLGGTGAKAEILQLEIASIRSIK